MAWFYYGWLYILLECIFKQNKIWRITRWWFYQTPWHIWNCYFHKPTSHTNDFKWTKIIWIIKNDQTQGHWQAKPRAIKTCCILCMDAIWMETFASWSTKLRLKSLFITTWIKSVDPKEFHKKQIFIQGSLHCEKENLTWSRKIYFSTASYQRHSRKRKDCWQKYFWRKFSFLWCSIKTKHFTRLLSVLKNSGYWPRSGFTS